jgi:hypothetical protein
LVAVVVGSRSIDARAWQADVGALSTEKLTEVNFWTDRAAARFAAPTSTTTKEKRKEKKEK